MTDNDNLVPTFPAEWEPQDAVILAWPHEQSDWWPIIDDIQKTCLELIKHITRFELVVLIIPDADEFTFIQTLLHENKINPEKVIPVLANYNDTWVRDTGPISIKINDHIQHLDFRFNGWGNKFEYQLDDRLCKQVLSHLHIKQQSIESLDIILEGGSIDVDGNGTLLTTQQCLLNPNRNKDFNEGDYEKLFMSKMGIRKVHWLKYGGILGDDTDGHIDMLARFCSREVIACSTCSDKNDPHHETLTRMKDELEKLKTEQGNHYQIIELPIPTAIHTKQNERLPASYSNFLIINNAILVPVYDDKNDKLACERLAECFPSREIIPLNALNIIQQGGSLHCLTMQLPRGSIPQ